MSIDKSIVIILNCCPLGESEVEFWNSLIASYQDQFSFCFLSTTDTKGINADTCLRIDYGICGFAAPPPNSSKDLNDLIQRVADKQRIWEAYDDRHSPLLAYSWLVTWTIIFRTLKPCFAIAWNGHHVPEAALKEVCNLEGVEFAFAERGPLAGTFALDYEGINCESSFYKRFHEIESSISPAGIEKFRQIYFEEGMSNWEQPGRFSSREDFCNKLSIPRNKIILFFPSQVERDTNSKLYSPHFTSTFDAFGSVVKWANDHADEVYLLAKKHPKQERPESFELVEIWSGSWVANVHIFDCIQFCDGVISINSASAVEAALIGKPVLLLGNSILELWTEVLRLDSGDELNVKLDELKVRAGRSEPLQNADYFARLLFGYLYSSKPDFLDLGMKAPSQFPFGFESIVAPDQTVLSNNTLAFSYLLDSEGKRTGAAAKYAHLLSEARVLRAKLEALSGSFWVRAFRRLGMIKVREE